MPKLLVANTLFICMLIATPSIWADNAQELNKKGSGAYRWWGIKIYDASLYVSDTFDGDYQTSRPLALEIQYDLDVETDDLIESTQDEWEDLEMVEEGACSDHPKWLTELKSIWPNLKQGDRLKFFVDTDQSQFYFNNQPVGSVADDEFANCFLAIWLSADTNAPSLRRKLLNIKKKRRRR